MDDTVQVNSPQEPSKQLQQKQAPKTTKKLNWKGFGIGIIIVVIIEIFAVNALKSDNKQNTLTPPKPTTVPTNNAPTLDQQTHSAKKQLAQKLSINESLIHVVSAQAVKWPDGSLGCAQPGEYYIESFVSGYQIILSYKGKNYNYHANTKNQPFLCENNK